MKGWKRWATALVTLMAGATVIVLALHFPDGLRSATSIGGLIAALAPLCLGLIVWARRPPTVALATSTSEQTDAAHRHLATQVLSQWRDEIDVRRLDDPDPLAVRWRSTELDVVDRAEHTTRSRLRRSPVDVGPHGLAGRSDRIGELAAGFRRLKRRRLVILGSAGTGKTTLAMLLLRDLVEHAEPGDPVPVLLSMAGWDPSVESLRGWLARQLAEDYPALRADVFGPDSARALVAQRRILPVLDGLDELPDEVRPAVLVRLNETGADPLVLTCRTMEYQAAVTSPGGDALTGGAVIEPAPLAPTEAARYLDSCLPPGNQGSWEHLLDTLRSGTDSPITTALTTPLALWLLRKVYVDTRTDPTVLRDTRRFPDADAVLDHLTDHFPAAAIRATRPHDDHANPFHPRRLWDPTDATTWLSFLAHHLNAIGTHDLAWWQLHRAAPRAVAVTSALIGGITLALAGVLHDGLRGNLAFGLVIGPVIGTVFGLVVGFARRLTVGHVLGLFFGLDLLVVGIGAELAGHPAAGLVFIVASAIPVAVVAALSRRAAAAPNEPAYANLRLRRRSRQLARKLIGWNESGLALRFVPGFAAGFVFGGTLGLAFGGIVGITDPILNGLVSGLFMGMVSGLASWLAIGLVAWAETPITDDRPRTPASAFRSDLWLVFVKALAGGAALGSALGVQDALTDGTGLQIGLSLGALSAVAIALGVGLHQPSGRYLVAVLVLRLRKQIPLQLRAFLEDAHRLGILRQTGALYQFRHTKLQDRLAGRPDQLRQTAPGATG